MTEVNVNKEKKEKRLRFHGEHRPADVSKQEPTRSKGKIIVLLLSALFARDKRTKTRYCTTFFGPRQQIADSPPPPPPPALLSQLITIATHLPRPSLDPPSPQPPLPFSLSAFLNLALPPPPPPQVLFV